MKNVYTLPLMFFKVVLLFVLAIPACAIAYYYAVVLPNHERATLDLEKQKFDAAQEEKKAAKDAGDLRDAQLEACLQSADNNYFKDIRNNGTPAGNGSYNVDTRVQAGIDRRKQNAITECEKQSRK